MWHYVLPYLIGTVSGIIFEYVYHWYMHKKPLQFHFDHHKDFFHEQPRVVADKARCLKADLVLAIKILLGFLPFMYFFGWLPVSLIYAGMFVHLMIVYHTCHHLFHDDMWLPAVFRNSRAYKWWRGCHMAHHFHAPRGNFCVTFPFIDMLLGTYIRPRPGAETGDYRPLPPKRKPRKKNEII